MSFVNLFESKIKALQSRRKSLQEALFLVEDLPKELSQKIMVNIPQKMFLLILKRVFF